MNLDSRAVAAPSGFRQTPRIALGKRTRFDESLKDQIAARSDSVRRRTARRVLFWLRIRGMRETQAAKHASYRRAAVRITRGGPHRILVGHRSSRCCFGKELLGVLVQDESPASDRDHPQTAYLGP